MKIGMALIDFALNRPKLIAAFMGFFSLLLILLVAIPSLFPQALPFLAPLKVDTDPENMLSAEEPVRVFHREMKQVLNLHDIVVVGVVNHEDPNGVFNPESLGKVHALTEYAKTLVWPSKTNPEEQVGVVVRDMIAPSVVDNIEQGGIGEVRFEWLMPSPPESQEEALALRDKARRLPFLEGTMVSEDGKALALYLPLTSKDQSYRVYSALKEKIATFEGADEFYITGLPVANDTFGVEMFIQMAISAPMAMLVIFLLMLLFFRKLILIVSPLIVALVSVVITMGLLVVTGNTVHIMSSMIPIFIMPIAVLDSIHILSEFFDRYQESRDRRKTIEAVMQVLFMPMLYTSLTSAAGFASLALTPIPPVQVFGIFVAVGILSAWLLTILFIPAYVMMIPQRRLDNFGAVSHEGENAAPGLTDRFLKGMGNFTYHRVKLILAVSVVAVVVAGYGMSKIVINDNPTKWFKASHPIRVADRVLNDHFGGTYMAYLALKAPEQEDLTAYLPALQTRFETYVEENAENSPGLVVAAEVFRAWLQTEAVTDAKAFQEKLRGLSEAALDAAQEDDAIYAWEDILSFIGLEGQRDQVFKDPQVLAYLNTLQQALQETGVVGKSNSLTDLVKTVHRELFEGKEEAFRVPDSSQAVAQCLITYESSHRPQDLYHFVTPDYHQTSIWVQLKSGDNQDMSDVVAAMDDFIAKNPPPRGLSYGWFGLTYINVIWQEKMVSGMMQAFLGSFLVVLLLMTILFRSALWGLLCMIPLTITIGLIYGVIGIIGKDYDMPVAVLSSLTLGLAVDFAIHFLARARSLYDEADSWEAVHGLVFGEPARAITRNVIVIAVGFLPLLFAPLVPYITVGVFLAAILFTSGAGTLIILPALIKVAEPLLFPKTKQCSVTCQCGTCIVSGIVLIALVLVNVYQFLNVGWTTLSWVSLALIPLVAVLCRLLSKRQRCMDRIDSQCNE